MAAEAQIKAVITADDRASGVLKGFSNSLDDAKTGSFALLGGLTAVAGGAALCVKAFSESEDVASQLDAVLRSTAGAAGVTSDAAIHLSKSLQSATTFSDEQVLSAENLLLTFTKIGKDIFPQATETVLDMATALGEDTKSASIQLGKALQDPILGITALRRVGVNFSDDQKTVIENLVKTGQQAKAQQLILKELNTEFGGSARAAAETFSGALKQIGNSLNDVMEGVGAFVVKGLDPLIGGFSTWINNAGGADGIMKMLTDRFAKLQPYLPIIGGAIMGGLVPAFIAMAGAIWSTLTPLLPFIAAGALLAYGAKLLIEHFGGLTATLEHFHPQIQMAEGFLRSLSQAFSEAIDFVSKHQIILAAFAGVVATVLVAAFTSWALAAGAAALATIAATWPLLAIGAAIGAVVYLIVTHWNQIKEVVGNVWEFLKAAFSTIADGINWLKDHWIESIGFIIGFFATLPFKLLFWVSAAFAGIVNWILNINWGSVANSIGGAFGAIWDGIKKGFSAIFDFVVKTDWGKAIGGTLKSIGNGVIDLIQGAINGAFKGLPGSPSIKLPHFAGGVQNFGGGLAVVGERGAEVVRLPPGSDVIPNNQLGGLGGSTINISINSMYSAGSEQEKRTFAKEILTALKDVANQKNTSVTELMGV